MIVEPIRPRAKFFFEGDKKVFLKGVTYGPFSPDALGDYIGTPTQLEGDLQQMRNIGINLLRIYHVPPAWFLDLLKKYGLRVLITLPWAEHVAFLNHNKIRKEILKSVRTSVYRHRGHPAIFGYLIGNEIPTSIIRWLGVQRVTEFLEEMISIGRSTDPTALFSYASFPPTEFLLPQNVDFYTFNVYLHNQIDFEHYLLRLQNLAEEKPLIMGEFGMDTIRHPEEEHAEMLSWHVDSVVRCGLAGTFIYAWTDEWFTGGMDITDWAFGLVTRDRKPKKAFYALKEKWAYQDENTLKENVQENKEAHKITLLSRENYEPVTRRVKLPSYPKVSVIVCSYNGDKTLEACLESLLKIDYPHYEIVVVDDGSKDSTPDIVKKFEGKIVSVRQRNMGLSFARNVGAHTATGEILAYTDGDCMADPDWLYYLVGTLLSGEYAGVGGPNISPPAQNWIQACVAAAPGGPSHVLLTDVVAEHIPGCNMAFHRWAFDLVGGFDPQYRKAGDDVDFCWRLQSAGQVIAFSPAAIVWHYRRFTLKAFRTQQEGYGEAESMLRFNHLIFFGPTGTAKWKGMIYGAPRFTWLINEPIIYHGVFGQGLFQSIYPTPRSEIANYVSSIEWFVLTLFIFFVSTFISPLRIVPFLMFGATFSVALSYMIHARLERKFDTIPARLLVMILAFTQPLVRGWARYYTWLKFNRTPSSVFAKAPKYGRIHGHITHLTHRNYWNEDCKGRDELIAEIAGALETEGWRYSLDTGWKSWDVQIYGNFWWMVRILTVTEYHGGPKCLTRVEMKCQPVMTTLLTSLLIALTLIYQIFFLNILDTTSITIAVLLGLFLTYRAMRLKLRVASLVEAAAHRVGLARMFKSGVQKKPSTPSDTEESDSKNEEAPSTTPVSPMSGDSNQK